MADMRTMVVYTDAGQTYENPSGGLLWTLLESVGPRPEKNYLLLYPDDDHDTYLIAAHTPDGAFFLQMQTPGGKGFVLREHQTFEQVHEILVRWAFGRTPWTDLGDWIPVPQEEE